MSDDTRNRILEAAGPIFADKGFNNATVREICAAAGTNQAAVNYHFRDKETLYLEVVKQAHQQRLEQFPAPQWPSGTTASEKLKLFVQATLARMLESRDLQWPTCLMMREVLEPTIACQAIVEDYIRPQLAQLMEILAELEPPGTPEHVRYKVAFSVIGQCVHYRVAAEVVSLLISPTDLEEHFQTEQLAEHIAEFTLAALKQFRRDKGGKLALDNELAIRGGDAE